MLNNISWQSYWTTLALLLAGYYLIIYLLYYRSDFSVRFRRKTFGGHDFSSVPLFLRERQPSDKVQSSLFDVDSSPEFQRPEVGTEEYVLYSCMDELTAFFEEAGRRKWVKEELMQVLQNILHKYRSLKASSYKESLSNVVVAQCEQNCSIHLNAEDLVRVWFGK
jgi:hypothetical protein